MNAGVPPSGSPPASPPAEDAPPPWQPFTFRSVAAFARASWWRLFLVQLAAAIIFAAVAVWFLSQRCAPVITQAVQLLPDGAKIESGRLAGVPTNIITQNKFLALAVTPGDEDIGQSADAQIQFRKTNVRVGSVFNPNLGWEFGYDTPDINLSRAALEPAWGAWRPVLLACCGAATVLALFVNWALLAAFYAVGARFMAFCADRLLSWPGAWRLCGAALVPGSLLLSLALALYGLGQIDLLALACFYAAHIVVGWVYTAVAPFFGPRALPPPSANPFTGPPRK